MDHSDTKSWYMKIFIPILIIWFLYPLIINRFFNTLTDRGLFGDTFGALNTLFSGLAFGGVIIAILLQRKELELQRKELQLTRAEIKGQKEQLRLQNETLKKQNFESTFFQLLKFHIDFVGSLKVSLIGTVTTGRECFSRLYENSFRPAFLEFESSNVDEESGIAKISSDCFSKSGIVVIFNYTDNLYNLIKYVDNSDTDKKDFYANFIKAQFSEYELLILFYYSLSNEGYTHIRPLLNKYNLLDNLPTDKLLNEDHIKYFEGCKVNYNR